MNNINSFLSGCVEPSTQCYVVTEAHRHNSIKEGDEVVVIVTPDSARNYLLRLSDMTLHSLQDSNDQYVHLVLCTAVIKVCRYCHPFADIDK